EAPPMLLALPLLAALPALQAAPPERTVALDALGLTLTLPELEGLAVPPRAVGNQVVGAWTGKLGTSAVRITVWALETEDFGFVEPEHVVDLVRDNLTEGELGKGRDIRFGEFELLAGAYGLVAHAATVVAEEYQGTGLKGELWFLAGIAPEHGYALQVDCVPPPDEAGRGVLRAFFEGGVAYAGAVRDPLWTEEEVDARWKKDAPDELAEELDKILRTEHYIILTNSGGGKSFSKKMEECYDAIREVYPFQEVEGRRLMPVFLFRRPEEYFAFTVKRTGWPLSEAQKTKGHAYGDYYATWYESPNDTTHIHEATHQIFANRLMLNGGGSWFQEGVAEYMEDAESEMRNFARGSAKRDEHIPFREFFAVSSLALALEGTSKRDGSMANAAYLQAGSIVQFVRDDKRTKAKFHDYVHAIGKLNRGDVAAIERELQRLFGWKIAEFEAAWKEYWLD
ncbi:MAG TPA: hypothetical protein VJP77_02815, partial [Planctomycetota bacterium]|nr:hypothetical protein [Planctomycetota bacterium]